MLALPPRAIIDVTGARALMAVSRDGTIAATVIVNGYRTRPVVWNAANRARALTQSGSIVSFDRAGGLLLDAGRPLRANGTNLRAVDLSACEAFPHDSIGPVLAGELENGALIASMRSPAIVDLDDTSGQNAPVALYMRSGRCLNLGNGIAVGTAGMFAVGYTAFINNVPAPSNVVSSREQFTAMRWHERERQPLGSGVALAINAAGAAVGADVPTGRGTYDAVPHAKFWSAPGAVVELAPNAQASVAYAIDADNRIAGMLEESGRHYAFIWKNRTLMRLDDVVASPGWRFECAYAFTPTGGVVGIGTYRGRAAAYDLEGLTL